MYVYSNSWHSSLLINIKSQNLQTILIWKVSTTSVFIPLGFICFYFGDINILIFSRNVLATEALIEAIKEFQGGVLLVSHDQHLLTSVCKDLYVVEKGNVEVLRHGNSNSEAFERYKKDVVSGRRWCFALYSKVLSCACRSTTPIW